MDCEAASERLPWLLNGTLEGREAEEVRGHIETCPRCRAEMDETRKAAAVFGAHLPAAAVIDLAWDRSPQDLDRGLADRHLASCPECREELDLARESRRLEQADAAEPIRRRTRVGWPAIALPATLAAGLAVGLWWDGARGTPAPVPADPPSGRIAALESEVDRLRTMVARLEAAASQASLPRVNLPLFEVLPASLERSGSEGEDNEIAVPAGATEIALLLSADVPQGTPATLTLRQAAGGEVWRGEDLVAGPPGGYVVVVPVSLVPDGRYVLTLRPRRGGATEYEVRVRRAG